VYLLQFRATIEEFSGGVLRVSNTCRRIQARKSAFAEIIGIAGVSDIRISPWALSGVTGAMSGEIIAGRLAGTKLDQLELSTLVSLLDEFDAESRDLLAAYLDRRHPRWREDAQGHAAAGSGAARSGKMTKEETYQILGLEPGASTEQIGRAHRGLMKKLHPDQGGSTYLAARVNEAKDVLLRRNR
jgi:DnaJ domain